MGKGIDVKFKFVDEYDELVYACSLDFYKGAYRYVIKNVPTNIERIFIKWGYDEGYYESDIVITELLPGESPRWDGEEINLPIEFRDEANDIIGVSFFELSKNRDAPIDLTVHCPYEVHSETSIDRVSDVELEETSRECDCYYILHKLHKENRLSLR